MKQLVARIERVCVGEGFPFRCPVCEEVHEDWDYLRIYLGDAPNPHCVHIRCLPPWLRQMLDLESESEEKPMTLEEIIIHIWDMAIASVRPRIEPYDANVVRLDANVVRQNTLKWASFELNERIELALQAGMKKVADYREPPRQPKEEPFFTFYLIDLKKQNGKLFWRWTGTPKDEWQEIEDILSFLALYYPLKWRSFICKTIEYPQP